MIHRSYDYGRISFSYSFLHLTPPTDALGRPLLVPLLLAMSCPHRARRLRLDHLGPLLAVPALFVVTNSAFARPLHARYDPHASWYRASPFRFPIRVALGGPVRTLR